MSEMIRLLTPEETDEMVSLFISLTAAEYGKQRFFQHEDGTWYDRYKCDYITTAAMILRAYETLEPYVTEGFFERGVNSNAIDRLGRTERTGRITRRVHINMLIHG